MIEIKNGAIISMVPVVRAINPVVSQNTSFVEVRYVYQGIVYKRVLPLLKERNRPYLDFSVTAHNNLGVVYV